MNINFKLEAFEGPLDLLLHLIKTAEVDIYNIPISEITDQYMEYIKAMEEMDLDIASEFLLMAATLLEIKSKMLLPESKENKDGEEEAEDPRAELVEKLVEYKKYKEFAQRLSNMEQANYMYFRLPEEFDDIEDKEVFFDNITVENLMHAFQKVIKLHEKRYNKRSEIPKNIDYDQFRIEDKMDEIYEIVCTEKSVEFEYFFDKASCKMEIIVIFLALLELIKLRRVRILQYKNFGGILIEGLDENWMIS